MTTADIRRKRFWFVLTWCYFLSGYYLVDWINQSRVVSVLPFFSGETAIPFWPPAIYAYLLVGPTVLLFYWQSTDWDLYWRGIRSYWLLFAIHAAFYLAYPITFPRPTPVGDGVAIWLTQLYFALDPPRNLFPSFHVSQCLLFSLLLWNTRKPWGYVALTMTTLVAISTVLIKQHYVADVLAAVPLTLLVWRLLQRWGT